MNGDETKKQEGLSERFLMQINMQQTDESLRRARNEISSLTVEIRKLEQDYARTKIALDTARARLKSLKLEEFDLTQLSMKQKRQFISKK